MATFHLSIVTPEETVLDETVTSIIVPGAKGYLGVMAHHAPLISPLVPGKLSITLQNGTEVIMAVSGGFIEVAGNRATILADAAEAADEIEKKRAQDALERARRRLHDAAHGDRSWDVERATASFHRAKNRLRVLDDSLVHARS
jgi:F-type H+-transporting ATPase subunit epsilon